MGLGPAERNSPPTEETDDESGGLGSLLRQVAEIPEVRRRPPEPDRTGQRLAHFRIRSKLGQGGMGIVYAADDLKLRRKVALKVLPLSMVADEERRRRFLREARAVAAVLHPNLATVFDVGESDGTVFLAMEHVDGITLRAFLEQHGGRLDAAPAVRIVREIARGLAKAHRAGVVHRDLKPENVMIAVDGTVKVLDFGLAKLTESADIEAEGDNLLIGEDDLESRVGKVLGTPGYMSPEQAAGAEVDARTDVFSVGVILYEMLSGVRPFWGRTTREILHSMEHDRPRPIREVVRGVAGPLVRVVERCLEKRKEDRFTDGTALLAELDRSHGELAGKSSRARIGTGAGALAFVLVAGAGAWVALRGDAAAPSLAGSPARSVSSETVQPAAAPRGSSCSVPADCPSGSCNKGSCGPWSASLPGARLETVTSVAVASDGDIVIGGYFAGGTDVGCGPLDAEGPPDNSNMIVARFAPRGTCIWSKRFGGLAIAGAQAVAVTADSHVVVAGGFAGAVDFGGGPLTPAGIDAIVVLELDARGNHVWSKRFSGAAGQGPNDAKLDANGDILVTGYFFSRSLSFGGPPLANSSAPGQSDVFVVKLTRSGNHVWSKAFGGRLGDSIDWAAIDSKGDVAITGSFREKIDLGGGPIAASPKMVQRYLAKLSGSDGSHVWSRSLGAAPDQLYEGDVAFDASGNVVTVGEHRGADLGGGTLPGSAYVAKYTATGEHLWSRGFGGTSPRDCARRVAVDAGGNVIVLGRILSPTVVFDAFSITNVGGSDLYLANLDGATGRVLAIKTFFATDAPARALALYPTTGNVVVGGRFEGTLRIGSDAQIAAGQDGWFASLGPFP